MMLPDPVVEEHQGIIVVRDDQIPGGTKSRYLLPLFQNFPHVVYASPACGGAQLSLAYCAQLTNRQATVFVAQRKQPHARTLEAKAAGAHVFQVSPGYLTNVQAKARRYAASTAAYYMEFGGESPEAIRVIAEAAARVKDLVGKLDEVWCAAGSGVLIRGLQCGLEAKRFFAVQVGHVLTPKEVSCADILVYPLPFDRESHYPVPFPSCRNYDAKAWEYCVRFGKGRRLFWNVLGPSPTSFMGLQPRLAT